MKNAIIITVPIMHTNFSSYLAIISSTPHFLQTAQPPSKNSNGIQIVEDLVT